MFRDNKENWPIYDFNTDYKIKEKEGLILKGGCGQCYIKGGYMQASNCSSSRVQEDDTPDNPIEDLRQRVEELEASQLLNNDQVGVLIEIIHILSEMPAGKQILNRALNLRELEKLQKFILPRRKRDLAELFEMKMPEGIREEMSTRQLNLIKQTLRHISHRRHFENNSSETVRLTMAKFFRKVGSYKALIHKGGLDVSPT